MLIRQYFWYGIYVSAAWIAGTVLVIKFSQGSLSTSSSLIIGSLFGGGIAAIISSLNKKENMSKSLDKKIEEEKENHSDIIDRKVDKEKFIKKFEERFHKIEEEITQKFNELSDIYDKIDRQYNEIDEQNNEIHEKHEKIEENYAKLEEKLERKQSFFCTLKNLSERIRSKFEGKSLDNLKPNTREFIEKMIDFNKQFDLSTIQKNNDIDNILRQHFSDEELSDFECPISKQVMQDPVKCPDGYCYDRNSLATWEKVCQLNFKPVSMPLNPSVNLSCSVKELPTDEEMKKRIDDMLNLKKPIILAKQG